MSFQIFCHSAGALVVIAPNPLRSWAWSLAWASRVCAHLRLRLVHRQGGFHAGDERHCLGAGLSDLSF